VTIGRGQHVWAREAGYAIVDVVMGLVLLGLVVLSIYQVFLPAFALSRTANDRLAVQQDARLAIDRMTRAFHETTLAPGRIRVYSAEAGCAGAYGACVGVVTARSGGCAGPFQLLNGAPDWQATIYLWREVAANELRMRCDPGTVFPARRWPPPVVEPYTVIGTHVVAITFAPLPASGPPVAIAVTLQERLPGPARAGPGAADVVTHTVFVPENR
jgi:Tfp pilus assembly protein PilX